MSYFEKTILLLELNHIDQQYLNGLKRIQAATENLDLINGSLRKRIEFIEKEIKYKSFTLRDDRTKTQVKK